MRHEPDRIIKWFQHGMALAEQAPYPDRKTMAPSCIRIERKIEALNGKSRLADCTSPWLQDWT